MIELFFGVAVLLLILGVPIAVTVGFSSIVFIFANGIQPSIIIQRLFTGIDSTALMAIPMFILAGELMNRGGLARRLVDMANKMIGNVTGGLALITILACMFFAAISGSGVATAAAIGAILIPSMVNAGYDRPFASAVVATASPIGVIIPPSISFVVYGVLAGVSITDLYKAGIPAGIIVGLCLMVVAYFISKKRGYKKIKVIKEVSETMEPKKWMLKTFLDPLWALMTPVIIVGGVFSGIFTATESAVVAVLYSMFIGLFVYKELNWKDLPKIILDAGLGSAKIMFIIANAMLFAWVMAYARIPQLILQKFLEMNMSPFMILLFINIVLLIAGTFMETSAILLIAVPIFLPLIKTIGIDPVHFGIIVTVNTAVGLVTPPFGVCLFTTSAISGVSVWKLSRAVAPFIVAMIVATLIITYFPQLVMFLVH